MWICEAVMVRMIEEREDTPPADICACVVLAAQSWRPPKHLLMDDGETEHGGCVQQTVTQLSPDKKPRSVRQHGQILTTLCLMQGVTDQRTRAVSVPLHGPSRPMRRGGKGKGGYQAPRTGQKGTHCLLGAKFIWE